MHKLCIYILYRIDHLWKQQIFNDGNMLASQYAITKEVKSNMKQPRC